jgi:hypothetical protein
MGASAVLLRARPSQRTDHYPTTAATANRATVMAARLGIITAAPEMTASAATQSNGLSADGMEWSPAFAGRPFDGDIPVI